MIQRGRVFTKLHRLNRPVQFQKVFKSACRSDDNYMLVVAIKNNSGTPRLGMAISKKNIKTAIKRNRIKRIVRESFRANIKMLEKLDIVVMAHKDAGQAENRSIKESLAGHWQRITECKKY